ncbi:MAG: hypothetical protein R2769_12405 [Saprospiraceae bacterium]
MEREQDFRAYQFEKNSSYTFRVSLQVHPDVELPCPDINDLLVKQIDSILEYNNQGWLDYDLDLGKDTIVTNNQSITLAPSIPDGVTSIEWSNGSNSPSIDVTRSSVFSESCFINGMYLSGRYFGRHYLIHFR